DAMRERGARARRAEGAALDAVQVLRRPVDDERVGSARMACGARDVAEADGSRTPFADPRDARVIGRVGAIRAAREHDAEAAELVVHEGEVVAACARRALGE